MAAKSSSGILGSHLQDIIDIGFGRWAKVDPLLARIACTALQRLSEDDKKKLLASNGNRIFGILESLITGSWLPENIWYGAADKAIGAIYTLHPAPEIIAVRLVKKSQSSLFDCGESNNSQPGEDSGITHAPTMVQVGKLSRYLFVISHVAMHQLVYIESCVRKIQKQRAKKEKLGIEANSDDGSRPAHDAPKDTGINAELGVAASEDAVLDMLADRAEKEIISGNSAQKHLLGYCAPFLSKLCRNFGLMQKNPELQAAAMLALCRFMIVDADFCEANLQLLFTVVESAASETVRSNCTIALGDLAVRFPNLLEPWTENMYASLGDPSASVRKNAVLVLSHLILNDMMKVKGYINEMAVRLEDEDDRISNLAKLFFTELSKKGSNPIYNLLPDILSKLSAQNLKRESYCNIMQFLIGSIKKDKQMEGLVEKLCNRFSGVTDINQCECLAYCLSQLAFTEKGMKKLIELFKTYEHALCGDAVMDHFRNIINRGKKFAKPELKSSIEEFEEKLNKFHLEKKEQEATARNAQAHRNKVGSLEGLIVDGRNEEENAAADTSEDGEVIDPSVGGPQLDSIIEPHSDEAEDQSTISSDVIQSEASGEEILSPIVNQIDMSKSRGRKSKLKDQNGVTSAKITTRSMRSRRR